MTSSVHGQRDQLRAARARLGLSQITLAEKSGIHYVTIARLEKERQRPSLDHALALAAALETTVESLFGETA